MSRSFKRVVFVTALLVLSLACGQFAISVEPEDQTNIGPQEPTETETSPTITPDAATPTLFPGTISPTGPSAGTCNHLRFVADVTIPDGMAFQPGQSFTKIWRLENIGTCTWTEKYSLVFTGGAQMSSQLTFPVPFEVPPGSRLDMPVTLTVPDTTGTLRSDWMLQSSNGERFGYGDSADKAFYVEIISTTSATTVSGRICYPSEFIPPMNLYLQNMITNQRFQFDIITGQSSYTVEVTPGEYTAYVWTKDFEASGGYTDARHNLQSFTASDGQVVTDIDMCDWYGEPGQIPRPNPGTTATIGGPLAFPSEHIPAMRVIAFDAYGSAYYVVETTDNQQNYEIGNLPPGYYHVFAYPLGGGTLIGGYTEYTKCGLSANCPDDHAPVIVYVGPGDHFTDISPNDFYAPAGAFPADPTQ